MSSVSECWQCGACCRTFPIFASADDAEREPRIKECAVELKAWLKSENWDYQLFPLPFHESCPFLMEEATCRIYESRPAVCRRFEPDSEQCVKARQSQGVSPDGLKRG